MKNRPLLLILVCLGLGALVWYDNQPEEGAGRRVAASAPQSDAGKGAPAAGTEIAPPVGDGAGQAASDDLGEPALAPRSGPEEPGTEPSATDAADPEASAAAGEGEAPASPEAQHSGNPLASLDKSTLTDWVQRPLFAPSRKRPPETAQGPAPQAAVAKPPPPLYDLMGVVSEKGRAIALLRKKADGTNFRVEVGDMLGGWQVSKVDARAVTLMRDDGSSETVSIFRE